MQYVCEYIGSVPFFFRRTGSESQIENSTGPSELEQKSSNNKQSGMAIVWGAGLLL